jgi:hypothetical protein
MSQKNASSKLFDTLQRHAASLRIVMNGINEAYQLPPSSLQQFLKVPNSIAGVVITDHEGKFANRFYGSIFDNKRNLNIGDASKTSTPLTSNLTSLATAVARTALQLAGAEGNIVNKAVANESTIERLLYCFLYDSKCDYFSTLVGDKSNKLVRNESISRYVGVSGGNTPFVETLVKMLAQQFTGSLKEGDGCKNKSLPNVESDCWESFVDDYEIKSPAFSNDDYDSRKYSTWAESQ